jgi:tetratricopeptide (TPR) repeat protein
MLFSLRFRTQLRRTRPDLISFLDETITGAAKNTGGTAVLERRCITAVFDERAIGFWLGITILLEEILNTLEGFSEDLYGYVCVLGHDLTDDADRLVRTLSPGGTGLWCAVSIQKALSPFVIFDQTSLQAEDTHLRMDYTRINRIRSLIGGNFGSAFPYRDRIQRILKKESPRNTLLMAPSFIGKGDGLSYFCRSLPDTAPFLVIRFGSGGSGLSCFVDAMSPAIRSYIGASAGTDLLERLDALGEPILRERLNDRCSTYLLQRGKVFLQSLLEAYAKAAEEQGLRGVIITENIHNADPTTIRFFIGIMTGLFRETPSADPSGGAGTERILRDQFFIFGTADEETEVAGSASSSSLKTMPDIRDGLFSRVIRFFPETSGSRRPPEMPTDLWEIAYALFLLGRYFPARQFGRIFEEEGLNPRMVARAVEIFSGLGFIDCEEDPRPQLPGFAKWAEDILGNRQFVVHSMIRSRILAWVDSGRLRPCFNLIRILSRMGSESLDPLILDALSEDIINGTYGGIEEAIEDSSFAAVVGEKRTAPLLNIFYTSKALVHGEEREIREAFAEPSPEFPGNGAEHPIFTGYKARILANLAAYRFGIGDIAAATDAAKESMLLSQNLKETRGLARAYRLFALGNLLMRRFGDAIDYFSFAIESAERFDDPQEFCLTTYYAAAAHFLYGNISRAEQLILQSREVAVAQGRTEWADKADFFLGRIRFETGRYQDALQIFEGLQDRFTGMVPASAAACRDHTLAAWIYRTKGFLHRSPPPLEGTVNHDALLFSTEAAYLSGDYRGAVNLADKLLAGLSAGGFIFLEQPDWLSGFSQCELFLLSRQTLFTRLLSTYRALALCHLDRTSSASREQALESMRRVIREEGQPNIDPNDAFYYYAYYYVVQESGGMEVDMNTAISIAFKRLQSRASRIDDVETKRSFLTLNYWNNALGRAAKRHKLI